MGRGNNDKHSRTDSSTQHDNHTGDHIVNISTTAFPQQCSVTSTSSAPKNPRGTANLVVHLSGTVQSFNNCDNGTQDFSVATVNSSGIGNSFNNHRSGSQTFRDAQISCVDDSKRSTSFMPWKRDRRAHSGIIHSFNNSGSGSQTFDSFKLNQ